MTKFLLKCLDWLLNNLKKVGFVGIVLFFLGSLGLFVGAALIGFSHESQGLILATLGLGALSVGVGLISIAAAHKSDVGLNSLDSGGVKMVKKSKLEGFALSGVSFGIGIGFIVIGVACFVIGLYYSNLPAISVGLACVSLGIGLIGLWLAIESKKRMKAISNMEVREKIAMLYAYMGRDEERINSDVEAALELGKWVEPKLMEEFKKVRQEFEQFMKNENGNIENR